jgi:hypothetical protein
MEGGGMKRKRKTKRRGMEGGGTAEGEKGNTEGRTKEGMDEWAKTIIPVIRPRLFCLLHIIWPLGYLLILTCFIFTYNVLSSPPSFILMVSLASLPSPPLLTNLHSIASTHFEYPLLILNIPSSSPPFILRRRAISARPFRFVPPFPLESEILLPPRERN